MKPEKASLTGSLFYMFNPFHTALGNKWLNLTRKNDL
jgi:hypothetical protein